MCTRVALYKDPRQLAELFKAGVDPELLDEWRPRWNVGPTDRVFGVAESTGGGRIVNGYRWGLVPSWANDPATITNTFNARAETVATEPMFRSAFQKWRILVPVDAFYEWQKLGPNEIQPYVFKRADGAPIVLAGLREWWENEDGTGVPSATILTTEAGPDMTIHDRQPAVLEREVWNRWLDPVLADRDELESLLKPTAEGTLIHYPVGPDVINIRNDGPGLIEPVAPERSSR